MNPSRSSKHMRNHGRQKLAAGEGQPRVEECQVPVPTGGRAISMGHGHIAVPAQGKPGTCGCCWAEAPAAWLALHLPRLTLEGYSGTRAQEESGAQQRRGRFLEEPDRLLVVGGGRGEVHPRGEIPLGPRLLRKGTASALPPACITSGKAKSPGRV